MDFKNVTYPHSGLPLSKEGKGGSTHANVDGPWEHDATWQKLVMRRPRVVRFHWQEVPRRGKSETGSRLVVAGGWGEREDRDDHKPSRRWPCSRWIVRMGAWLWRCTKNHWIVYFKLVKWYGVWTPCPWHGHVHVRDSVYSLTFIKCHYIYSLQPYYRK